MAALKRLPTLGMGTARRILRAGSNSLASSMKRKGRIRKEVQLLAIPFRGKRTVEKNKKKFTYITNSYTRAIPVWNSCKWR
jgi:hypothetical protein